VANVSPSAPSPNAPSSVPLETLFQKSDIEHQTSEIRPPVQKQGRPIPNQRVGQAERLRNRSPQSEISNQKFEISPPYGLSWVEKVAESMTIGRMLQQRALHPRSDEARQNHQNPEAPLGFARLFKAEL